MTHAEATKLVLGKNNRMQRKVANNTTARIKPDGGELSTMLQGKNILVLCLNTVITAIVLLLTIVSLKTIEVGENVFKKITLGFFIISITCI